MNENGSRMNGAPGRENGSDSGSDKNDKRVISLEKIRAFKSKRVSKE